MFEGKELSGKIGEYGGYGVDLQPDGVLVASVELRVDLIAEVKKLADKTKTPYDNLAIAWIEGMLKKPVVA